MIDAMLDAVWFRIACVGVAGAAGALSRWGLGKLTEAALGAAWPTGTLIVNVLGCLLFGFVFETLREHPSPHAALWRLVLLTGFCGALTTFSTLAFDLYELGTRQGIAWAALNLALHLVLGMAAVFLGVFAGRAT